MGKVCTQGAELETCLAEARKAGLRIVSTNGVFDLLHVGHIRLLQQARSLGDMLVVCINSDASVQRLKGPQRPIVPENERAEMLAALACVDIAVCFEEDTPAGILEKIAPCVHVKGGDYRVEDLPETEVVQRSGGVVRILPFLPGHSTTGLLARLQKALQKESMQ